MALKEGDSIEIEELKERVRTWAESPEALEAIKAGEERVNRMIEALHKARTVSSLSLQLPIDQ